jgi:hypothetical protein
MPQFTYRARNAQGGLVEGVSTAQIAPLRSGQIESQHCIPIRIDMVEAAKPAEAKTSAGRSSTKIADSSSPEAATPCKA